MPTSPDNLLPACGGTETPFTVNGRRWLYCYHPASGRHCYLDVDNDMPVWHRGFHPAFHPELEFEDERVMPVVTEERSEMYAMDDFYF